MARLEVTIDPRRASDGARVVKRDLDDIKRRARDVEGATDRLAKTAEGNFRKMGERARALGQNLSLFVTTPLIALGTLATRQFTAFEQGLIGVGKTTDITGAQLEALGKDIQGISRVVPVATTDLLSIAQAAGQLGVTGNENIARFTETVGKLGLASNLAGEEAATSLARILTVTGTAISDVDRLGSTIVQLGNNFAATEAEIAAAATRVSQATSQFDAGAANVAGLGAALAAVGVEAEAGGTQIGLAFQTINDALREGGEQMRLLEEVTGETGDALREQFFNGQSVAVFEQFIAGLGRIRERGGDVSAVLSDMDLNGVRAIQVLGTLATRSDVLSEALGQASDEWERNTALNKEAATAATSAASQQQLMKNSFNEAASALATQLIPAVTEAMQALAGLFQTISEINPAILKWGVILGGVAAAIGPVVGGIGLLAAGIAALAPTVTLVTGGLGLFAGALAALSTPVLLVIGGLAALTTAVIVFWDDVKPIVDAVGAGFAHLWQGIINDIERVKQSYQSLRESTSQTLDVLSNMVDRVDELMGGRLTKAFEIPKRGAQGLVDTFRGLADTLVGNSIVPDMIDAIVAEFQRLPGEIGRPAEATKGIAENMWPDISRSAQTAADQTAHFWRNTTGGFVRNLRSGLDQGKGLWGAFADAATRAIDRINDKLLNDMLDAIFQVNNAASSGGGNSLFDIIGGFVGGLFGSSAAPSSSPVPAPRPSAMGNAFDHGRILAMAKGGIVDRPILFPMAHGAGLMGEAGPEAVMPLRRGSDGRLGVEMAGGGRRVAQSITINEGDINVTEPGASVEQIRRMVREERNETIRQIVEMNERDPSIMHT